MHCFSDGASKRISYFCVDGDTIKMALFVSLIGCFSSSNKSPSRIFIDVFYLSTHVGITEDSAVHKKHPRKFCHHRVKLNRRLFSFLNDSE